MQCVCSYNGELSNSPGLHVFFGKTGLLIPNLMEIHTVLQLMYRQCGGPTCYMRSVDFFLERGGTIGNTGYKVTHTTLLLFLAIDSGGQSHFRGGTAPTPHVYKISKPHWKTGTTNYR